MTQREADSVAWLDAEWWVLQRGSLAGWLDAWLNRWRF